MVEKDCRSCKTYKDCPGKATYLYQDIRWCPYQVMWLIENDETLRTIGWIIDDDNRGSRRNIPTAAPFVNIINVLAELDVRLKATGTYGEKLIDQAKEGRPMKYITPMARAALMYGKGWRRKKISFNRWLRVVWDEPKKEEQDD